MAGTAVSFLPSFYLSWKKLGEIYLRQGRVEEALHALEQARTLAPADEELGRMLEQARSWHGQVER